MATPGQTPGAGGFLVKSTNDNCKGLLAPPHVLLRSRTSRKPHRSSPLAGPAVLPFNNKGDFTTNPESVSRISSSRSLCDLEPSGQACFLSSQGLSRPTSMISSDSAPSYTISQDPSITRRRSMIPKELIRPISAFPLDSKFHRGSPWELSGGSPTSGESPNLQGCHRRYFTGLALSTSVYPADTLSSRQQPIPKVIINGPEPDVVDVHRTPPPLRAKSQSKNSDNSWYTTNTYAETPRFSRLGLAASNVVMPVSAKERKKCQQQKRQQHLGSTSGSGSLRSTDVSVSTGGSHSKEVNQQSLIGGLSSSLSRRSTRSNEARRHPSFCSPASPPRSERVPDTLQTSLTHSLQASTPPSSPTSASLSSSSPDSSPQRTRSNSFTDSLATTFSVPSITPSSQTSVSEYAADQHQGEGLVALQNVSTEEKQCARKLSSIGRAELAKKKSLLTRVRRWTVTSSARSVTMANKDLEGGENKSTEPLGQSQTKKSRSGSIRGFVKLFVSSK